MSADNEDFIILSINDNTYQVKIRRSACGYSVLLSNLLEDIEDFSTPIPLPNISSNQTLDDVVDFLNALETNTSVITPEERQALFSNKYSKLFNTDWVRPFRYPGIDLTQAGEPTLTTEAQRTRLFNMVLAAHYLDIESLLQIICHQIANFIKGKSPSEIRELFGMPVDSNTPVSAAN